MKNYIWIGIVILALIALMFWGVRGATEIEPPLEIDAVHPLDNVQGNVSSSVVVIEYSDFQCSACRSYYFAMKQLAAEFGDRAAFVYRYFPLVSSHPNSEFAARATQAAAKQGKFWQMHDILFEKQDEWSGVVDIEPLFESYATLIGISTGQFKTDFESRETRDFVRAQKSNAIKLRLPGTPTFFVNGKQIENPTSTEAFGAIIREVIK